MSDSLRIFGVKASLFSKKLLLFQLSIDKKMPADGYRLALYSCSPEWLSAVPADYTDLPRVPDDGATDRADIFDTAVGGFLAPTLGGSLYGLAAGIDFVLA